MIVLDNTYILYFDNLATHLTEKLHLKQSLSLVNSNNQVSLIYNEAANKYILVDTNDLTETKKFSAKKIKDLTAHLKAIFNYPTIQFINCRVFDPVNPQKEYVLPQPTRMKR